MIKVHFKIELPFEGKIMKLEFDTEKPDDEAYEIMRTRVLGEIKGMNMRIHTEDGLIPIDVGPEHIKDIWLETV